MQSLTLEVLLVATNRGGAACILDEVKRPGQRGQLVVTVVQYGETKRDVRKEVATVIDLLHGENYGLETLQGSQLTNDVTAKDIHVVRVQR